MVSNANLTYRIVLIAWLVRWEENNLLSACDEGIGTLELARGEVFDCVSCTFELGWLAGRVHLLFESVIFGGGEEMLTKPEKRGHLVHGGKQESYPGKF